MNQGTTLSGLAVILLFHGSLAKATDWQWDVVEKPPQLADPKKIDVSKLMARNTRPRDIHCGGKIYKVRVPDGKDAIVFMSGPDALVYPVQITGGRNVRVIGLHIDLVTQSGCEVGKLPNKPAARYPNANIHPRVPGAIALRLQQAGVSFVEGAYIDVRGHQADCFVVRNPDDLDNMQAREQRDVIIQNSVCRGVEGMGASDIGDGVHGDLFQNQGRDVMRRLVFENVSHRTSQEGIVLLGDPDAGLMGAKFLIVRRYDYSWDPRYVGDDDDERFGSALAARVDPGWVLEDIRIMDYPTRSGDYIRINDQRYGNSPSKNVKSHPEIKSGLPPAGAFALPEHTGLNYVSPHTDCSLRR